MKLTYHQNIPRTKLFLYQHTQWSQPFYHCRQLKIWNTTTAWEGRCWEGRYTKFHRYNKHIATCFKRKNSLSFPFLHDSNYKKSKESFTQKCQWSFRLLQFSEKGFAYFQLFPYIRNQHMTFHRNDISKWGIMS